MTAPAECGGCGGLGWRIVRHGNMPHHVESCPVCRPGEGLDAATARAELYVAETSHVWLWNRAGAAAMIATCGDLAAASREQLEAIVRGLAAENAGLRARSASMMVLAEGALRGVIDLAAAYERVRELYEARGATTGGADAAPDGGVHDRG